MFYKWLDKNGCASGGWFKWPLPAQNADGTWEPGAWVEVSGDMEGCSKTALHGCRVCDISTWVKDGDLYEFEMIDAVVHGGDDKAICQKARLLRPLGCTDKIKRLWACDMAEEVLPIFERKYPDDDRPRKAIQAGRDFAEGKITAAARDAAWDAARAAARAAVGAAVGAAAWAAAGAAAEAAARAAARAAAWAAAEAAAGAAAKKRHGQMLLRALGAL